MRIANHKGHRHCFAKRAPQRQHHATDNAHAAICPHCCGTGKVGVSREAIDGAVAVAAFVWWQEGGEHALVAAAIDHITQHYGVDVSFVVARARALGVPVL